MEKQNKWLRRTSSTVLGGGVGPRTQHLPVEHIAQGLVPDACVHRGAGLPSDQVGSVMEKVDVHQVKGAAETEKETQRQRLKPRVGHCLSNPVPARGPEGCGGRPGRGPGSPVGRATVPHTPVLLSLSRLTQSRHTCSEDTGDLKCPLEHLCKCKITETLLKLPMSQEEQEYEEAGEEGGGGG